MAAATTRIDYIRVAMPGDDPLLKADWKLKMEAFIIDRLLPEGDSFSKWASHMTWFDNSVKTWVTAIELWGQVADEFFHHWATPEYGTILRLDYRMEVDDLPCSLGQLEAFARKRNTNGFRTITRIDSRSRSKKGGRDAGGHFLAVGSRESQRRATVYKRGNEPWAIEVQFGRDLPQKMKQDAVQAYMETEGKYDSWKDALVALLWQKAVDAVRDQYGVELEYLLGDTPDENPLEGFEYQESLFSDLLAAIPEFAAEQVKKVVDLGIAELNRRAIIVSDDLIEPTDLWD